MLREELLPIVWGFFPILFASIRLQMQSVCHVVLRAGQERIVDSDLLKSSAEGRGGEHHRFMRLQVLLLVILLFNCGGSESVPPVEIKKKKPLSQVFVSSLHYSENISFLINIQRKSG